MPMHRFLKRWQHKTGASAPDISVLSKDSLWSVDLFRCESILLKSHWVLVIMDQFSRRLVGFSVHAGDVDGIALCCMFNSAIRNQELPKRLSSDNDPLFRYHQWQANLRILEVEEIKSVPYSPTSHPFIERLIGTIRRECLDRLFLWNAQDFERKMTAFQHYYNKHGYLTLNTLINLLAVHANFARCLKTQN